MRALIYIMTPILILTFIFASRYVTWEKLKGVDKQAGQLLTNGTQFMRNRKFKQAVIAFTQAIEIEPKYAEAYIKRGFAHYQLAQYNEAIADYTRTLTLKRYTADAYAARGDVYLSLNDRTRAINDYSASLTDRKNASVMSKRAKVYLDIGNFDKAIKEYSYILKRRPIALAYYYRGRAYHQKFLQSHNEDAQTGKFMLQKEETLKLALTDFDDAIKIQKNFAIAYLSRGDIYELLNKQNLKKTDYAKTIQLLTETVQDMMRESEFPPTQDIYQIIPIYLWRAVAYHRQQNINKAKNDIIQCYKLFAQFYLKKFRISGIL